MKRGRKAEVLIGDRTAGILEETGKGYVFYYLPDYLSLPDAVPVSLTLPLSETPYAALKLFPFFDGLIPEGWLLSLAEAKEKLKSGDRLGLLLACCGNCTGAVSIRPIVGDGS